MGYDHRKPSCLYGRQDVAPGDRSVPQWLFAENASQIEFQRIQDYLAVRGCPGGHTDHIRGALGEHLLVIRVESNTGIAGS